MVKENATYFRSEGWDVKIYYGTVVAIHLFSGGDLAITRHGDEAIDIITNAPKEVDVTDWALHYLLS